MAMERSLSGTGCGGGAFFDPGKSIKCNNRKLSSACYVPRGEEEEGAEWFSRLQFLWE